MCEAENAEWVEEENFCMRKYWFFGFSFNAIGMEDLCKLSHSFSVSLCVCGIVQKLRILQEIFRLVYSLTSLITLCWSSLLSFGMFTDLEEEFRKRSKLLRSKCHFIQEIYQGKFATHWEPARSNKSWSYWAA